MYAVVVVSANARQFTCIFYVCIHAYSLYKIYTWTIFNLVCDYVVYTYYPVSTCKKRTHFTGIGTSENWYMDETGWPWYEMIDKSHHKFILIVTQRIERSSFFLGYVIIIYLSFLDCFCKVCMVNESIHNGVILIVGRQW